MFGLITTIIEAVGALSIAIGIGLCFGFGAALIAGGALLIAGSYLASRGVAE